MPEIPEEITIEHVTGENAKLGLVGVAAIVGGFAIGHAAAKHGFETDKPLLPEKMTPAQGVAAFGVGTLGLVLFGKMVKDAIDEYGAETVLLTAGGITVAAVLVRAIRS